MTSKGKQYQTRQLMRQWAEGQGGWPSKELPRIFALMQLISKKQAEMRKLFNAISSLQVEVFVDLREGISTEHHMQPDRAEYLEMCYEEVSDQERRLRGELAGKLMKLYYEGWV